MYVSNVNTASIQLIDIQSKTFDAQQISLSSQKAVILFYIRKGAMSYDSSQKEHHLKKNDILIMNPHQIVDVSILRKVEGIYLELDGIIFTHSYDVTSNLPLFIIHDDQSILKKYFELLMIEHDHFKNGSEIILRKLSENILVHVLRNKHLSIKDSHNQDKYDQIESVQEFIQKNYQQKLTLDYLSEMAQINKFYFIRLFKQKTGLSPIDYLIHVRLAKAEKLLTESDLSIAEITEAVGFRSPSHFSKMFKENNLMTPSQFRKKFKINK